MSSLYVVESARIKRAGLLVGASLYIICVIRHKHLAFYYYDRRVVPIGVSGIDFADRTQEAAMSTNEAGSQDASHASVDMKFEAVVIPVSAVDRAKEFYGRLGWRLDADFPFDNGVRVVQFTPPGSPGAIQFGAKMTSAAPGSAENLYLIVSDIEAGRDELIARG